MPGHWRVVDGEAGPLRVYETPASPGGRAGTAAGSGSLVVLCHELPREPDRANDAGRGYPALADRLSEECACRVVVPMLRGTSGSAGDFSAGSWLQDLVTITDAEVGSAGNVWLIGFGFGGAIALRTGAQDKRVAGVATIAGPADLTAWVSNREKVLDRCRRSGVISSEGFPPDVDAWAAEIVALAPLDAAAHLGPRPLLVVHGSDDSEVPVAAGRAIADAATGGPVDLRIVPAAGHWLRADPRVVATLVGWIERHR